jgi:hypothetical protein
MRERTIGPVDPLKARDVWADNHEGELRAMLDSLPSGVALRPLGPQARHGVPIEEAWD